MENVYCRLGTVLHFLFLLYEDPFLPPPTLVKHITKCHERKDFVRLLNRSAIGMGHKP